MVQDYAVAVTWFREAAEQGYALHRPRSATCTSRAKESLKTTAQPSSGPAVRPNRETRADNTISAICTPRVRVVPRDDRVAVSWFRRAAEQGNVVAQFGPRQHVP